jgi:hypothetical protein
MATGYVHDDWGAAVPVSEDASTGRSGGQPAAPGPRRATARRTADVRRQRRAANRVARASRRANR